MLYRLIIRKLITNNLDFHVRTLPNLKIVKLAVKIEIVEELPELEPNQCCAKYLLCFIDISS
jgi:hypothetical protein